MRSYRVHKHPVHGLEAVKQGFSWPAFLFGPFWMLAQKLWGLAALWIAAAAACHAMEDVTDRSSSGDGSRLFVYLLLLVLYLLLWLVPAFKGNRWRETNLRRRGYGQVGSVVEAETPDAALAIVGNRAG